MENRSTKKIENYLKPSKTHTSSNETENELNSKILKVTMKMHNRHPELVKYLEEMPVTVPTEKRPEITLQNLRTYYESLNALLNKYMVEHPLTSE